MPRSNSHRLEALDTLFDGNLGNARYSPGAIANWFLERAAEDKKSIDQMKLQKLLYYAHGWSLTEHNQPLINEHAEAWEYGPVFPSVYHEFKKYGSQPIPAGAGSHMLELVRDPVRKQLIFVRLEINATDKVVRDLLERVWDTYGGHDGMTLSDMTHHPHVLNPWHLMFTKATEHNLRGADIPNTLIKDYFDHLKQNHLTH